MASKVVIGVATLPKRYGFFSNHVLPNLKEMADEVWVYTDRPNSPDLVRHSAIGTSMEECPELSVGDAGKFFGYERTKATDFYFLSCDDDLSYPLDYVDRMKEWIDFFEKKAAISLHGASFASLPVDSFYLRKHTIPCLGDFHAAQRVLFPGTGALAFHSSLLRINVAEHFLARNMADIWFGRILQMQKAPALVIPHAGNYLTYDNNLPIADTIWGQENQKDFLQTAVVNQISLDQGLTMYPLDWPDHSLPSPLGDLPESTPSPVPAPQE